MAKTLPYCSVIVLNYNGEKILPKTIDSLLSLNYSKNCYEIIIVDNHSNDNSKKVINSYEKKFQHIHSLYLSKNLGFAKGNNEGIKKSKGEYIAVLNNDCIVDTNWLSQLVHTAKKDKKIAAVNSKILLYPSYFQLKIQRTMYMSLKNAYLVKSSLLEYSKKSSIPIIYRIQHDHFILDIPFEMNRLDIIEIELIFKLKNKFNIKPSSPRLYNFSNSAVSNISNRTNGSWYTYRFDLDLRSFQIKNIAFNKIQNAGIYIFQDGYGRDIGASVRYHQQNYENDRGQYNSEKEVYAACGAASLYRKSALKNTSYFDESFFMYYEDVDLSEKLRMNGYSIYYSPKAIVKHLHAYSSGEWSPFFIFHAERGRLMHVLNNFPFLYFLREYLIFLLKSSIRLISEIYIPGRLWINLQYILIFISISTIIPKKVTERLKQSDSNKLVMEKIFKQIRNGYWYFN